MVIPRGLLLQVQPLPLLLSVRPAHQVGAHQVVFCLLTPPHPFSDLLCTLPTLPPSICFCDDVSASAMVKHLT